MVFIDQLPATTIDNRDRSPIPRWEASDATSLEEMLLPGKWPSVAFPCSILDLRPVD